MTQVLIFSFVPRLECDCEFGLWFNSKPYGNCKLQQYPLLHLLSHRYPWIRGISPLDFHPILSPLPCSIMGNCTVLHIVRTDPRLHQPMYYFLAMLSLTDMGMSLPTMISLFRVLWSISREIQFNTCVVQMFFIHTFSFTESSVFLAMALD